MCLWIDGPVQPGQRSLARDDGPTWRAFATGLGAGGDHGKRDASQTGHSEDHGVRIEGARDIEFRPHGSELQRVIVLRGLQADFLQAEVTEPAKQSRRDGFTAALDDFSVGGRFEVVSEVRDLAGGDQHVSVLEDAGRAQCVYRRVANQNSTRCSADRAKRAQKQAYRSRGRFEYSPHQHEHNSHSRPRAHGYTPAVAGWPSMKSDGGVRAGFERSYRNAPSM